MDQNSICIIGGGNLGRAIAIGLKKSGYLSKGSITLTRRNLKYLDDLKESGIELSSNNQEAIQKAHLIILAVQPKQLNDVLSSLKEDLNPEKHILVSVVTGVSISDIEDQVGLGFSVIRAMPNTAIAMQESMTCISSNGQKTGLQEVQDIFDQLGSTLIIDEQLMQAATVLGACGIAFFLRFIRGAS